MSPEFIAFELYGKLSMGLFDLCDTAWKKTNDFVEATPQSDLQTARQVVQLTKREQAIRFTGVALKTIGRGAIGAGAALITVSPFPCALTLLHGGPGAGPTPDGMMAVILKCVGVVQAAGIIATTVGAKIQKYGEQRVHEYVTSQEYQQLKRNIENEKAADVALQREQEIEQQKQQLMQTMRALENERTALNN